MAENQTFTKSLWRKVLPAAAGLAAVAGLAVFGWRQLSPPAAAEAPQTTAAEDQTPRRPGKPGRILPDNVIRPEAEQELQESSGEIQHEEAASDGEIIMEPYVDQATVRWERNYVLQAHQFDREEIYTYNFSSDTVFEGAQEMAEQVLEAGKNPGLGVRQLHEQGITGAGVNVAIIDQKLVGQHPEYADRIAAYYDSGAGVSAAESSMHGPSVLSLLAGETVGVAPGVQVYYAATPGGAGDASYFADCLDWIIAQNESLPAGEKIRVVSLSAAPLQEQLFSNGALWSEALARAQEAGILVITCDKALDTGFVAMSFCDPEDPENVGAVQVGFPNQPSFYANEKKEDVIFVPASYRTTALETEAGDARYTYWGMGGLSWSIPYAAGVLALGWQVNPDLDAQTMRELLFQSCRVNEEGCHLIDPVAFIELVREYGA